MREAEHQHPGSGVDRLDARRFAELFEQSWRTLWTIAVGVLGRREDVDDVLQESAMIALGKLDHFDPSTSFTAWMGQIVRYTALNSGRRRHRRASRRAGSNGVLEQTPAPSRPARTTLDPARPQTVEADQLGLDDRLLASIRRLNETQRACLLLRTVCDLSYRDIARIMDIPEGTAMSHVHRAQKSLREMMSDMDVASGDGGTNR